MIKKLLFTGILGVSGLIGLAQTLSLVYPFSNVTSTSGTIDPTPSPTAAGIISGSFMANGLSANPTTSNVFAFTGWPAGATPSNNTTFTGSIDPNKNFEIVLTPSTSYVIDLTDMYFYMNRSNTGPRHWAVRTNKDTYAANLPATSMGVGTGTVITVENGDTFFWSDYAVTTTNIARDLCKVSFTGTNYIGQFTPYSIRIYAWDGSSTAGSWRVDSVAINGNATFSLGVGLAKVSHDLNAGFSLYPNPAQDGFAFLQCKSGFDKLEIIDLTGQVMAVQNGISDEKIKLDLSTFPKGIYFVRISSGNKTRTEKLIVTK